MLLARKLKSAVTFYRRRGLSGVEELARINAALLYRSHRPIPTDPDRRARLLAETFNPSNGLSTVTVAAHEAAGVRKALLVPFLRHRFAEVVGAADAAASNGAALSPIEIAILAGSLAAVWDFPRIAASLPAWSITVAGTAYAPRIAQLGARAMLRLGRLDEARRGIETGTDVGSLVLRGEIYDAVGLLDKAASAFARALRRDGRDGRAHLMYAFHLLRTGRVLDGLSHWSTADTLEGVAPLRRHRPVWAGETLGRRRLMVLFEHGLGDMIQMARFLSALRAREPEAAIAGRVPAPLAGLMTRSFPGIRFITDEEPEPDYDVFVPSMQLPAVLEVADLEPRSRYIELPLPASDTPMTGGPRRPTVGICWRGHPRAYELTRSIPLSIFARIFEVPGIDFVVLLNRLTADEEVALAGRPGIALPPIHDFLDLAREIAACDLVVSVDTAVPHLAAAGGAPVILLSRPDACWRWGTSGPTSPWYATVDVLRHAGDMDWGRMLDEVATRLHALAETAPAIDGGPKPIPWRSRLRAVRASAGS